MQSRSRILTVLYLLAMLPLAPSGTEAAVPASDAGSIKAVTERWAAEFGKGDLASISHMYTADARILPEGSAPVVGQVDILGYFEKNLRPGMPAEVSFSNYEIYGDDHVATCVTDLEIRDPKGHVGARGKQILVLLKQDGQWKIHRDIWTNNGPVDPSGR
jgi:ketosteroid isomerase-like protein